MTFKPGQSGNPNGRPRGSRNKAALAIEALLDGEAEELTRKAIELAKGGDMPALRLCLERICPPRKDSPIAFELGTIETAEDIVSASATVLSAVAAGELTPSEGDLISRMIETHRRTMELSEFGERIKAIEDRIS